MGDGGGLTPEGVGEPPGFGVPCLPLLSHAARAGGAALTSSSTMLEQLPRRMLGKDAGQRPRLQSRPLPAARPIDARDGGGHAPPHAPPVRPPLRRGPLGLRGVARGAVRPQAGVQAQERHRKGGAGAGECGALAEDIGEGAEGVA